MKPAMNVLAAALAVGMVLGLIWEPAEHIVQAAEQTGETAQNIASESRTWSGGAAVGFLSNTPDGTAVALNLHADRFLQRNVSLGPLLQLGFTEDMTQVGFSGQGKYWIDISQTDNRAKLMLQAGVGFVHADHARNDTSFLIPLGMGVDYSMTQTIGLTGTFLLNFTDLDTGARSHTNVMPGLAFGVRF